MALPLVILGVRVGAQVASKLGPRAISALKKMDRGQVTKIVNKVKNAIKSKDTKRLENINQEIKKIGRQRGPKNVEAGPSMKQAQRLKKKETKLQQEKTAIAKRKEARKKRAKATADLTARTSALSLIKKPKKEDKPVDTNKKETKVNNVAPSTTSKTVTVKKGDTLSEIAKQTKNLTVDDLLKLNPNIKNPNQIKIGQKIKIDMPKEGKRKSVYEDFSKEEMAALDADAKGKLPEGSELKSTYFKEKKAGGPLRNIPAGNKGLPKLPTAVRNKMGCKKMGGRVQKRAGGGIALRGFGVTRKK